VTAPANTERLVEADVGFDDARLNHDLTHRNIQLGHDAGQLIQAILGFQRDDAVGAVVDGDGTTLLAATGDGGKEGGDVGSLGVVHLDQLTAQRCQLGDLLLGLQLLTLARSNFLGRSNQQDVADLTLVQTLGAEHQIQRLIPWHVLQAQGDAALNRVTGGQVEGGEVGNQLQDRAHLDVLEIEGKLVAGVTEGVSTALLNLGQGQRLETDDQPVVGLIYQMLVETGRLDIDGCIRTGGICIDEVDRCGEILHIQPYAQLVGQLGGREHQPHTTALLLHIHADGWIRQINDDVAFALLATLEVETADGTGTGDSCRAGYRRLIRSPPVASAGLGLAAGCGWRRCGIARRLTGADQNIQIVTLGPGSVRGQIGQIDDQAGTIIRFDNRHAAGIAQAQLAIALAQTVLDTRQVDGDTRRLIDGVAFRRSGYRL